MRYPERPHERSAPTQPVLLVPCRGDRKWVIGEGSPGRSGPVIGGIWDVLVPTTKAHIKPTFEPAGAANAERLNDELAQLVAAARKLDPWTPTRHTNSNCALSATSF